jgi:hypothetical protein
MTERNIELEIEQLVLHGFSPTDQHRIGEAVRTELARQLAEQGTPKPLERGGRITRLDAGSFDVTPGSSPDTVGSQVAQSVYQGLKR